MSNLSSYTLSHFTSSLHNLESILKQGLEYHTIAEKIPGRKFAYYVDCICFCNIPLSQIGEHLRWYGYYGVGIKRSFLKESGCSPVLYAHSNSPFFPKGNSLVAKKAYESMLVTGFIKRDMGKQVPKGKRKAVTKVFSDEKEWRIIKGTPRVYQVDNLSEMYALKQCHISNQPIIISPNEIEYIIVPNDDYQAFYAWLTTTFPMSYVDYLPKILTAQQILRDF